MRKYILAILIAVTLVGCATPLGVVKLDNGNKVERTEYRLPLLPWVIYTRDTVVGSSFQETANFLKSTGHWFIVGGLLAIIVAVGIHFSSASPPVQGLCLTAFTCGGTATGLGILSCLMANVWILGIVLVIFIAAVAYLLHFMWKTRKFSILRKLKGANDERDSIEHLDTRGSEESG